jgi:predicted dehydrogenase
VGAAIVATAPHEHAKTAQTLLSLGWNVLVEKPVALNLRDAQDISDLAAKSGLLAWVGMVYLFAEYLTVMRPYAHSNSRWLLEWYEPHEEVRWGGVKSTPHHVSPIEDVFPHAWSILRLAGLKSPMRIERVELGETWEPRINLSAGENSVELIIDRYAGLRRRYMRIEAQGKIYELDFTEEPGTFKIDGVVGERPPWNPLLRPLAAELSSFLAVCTGGKSPEVPVTVRESLEAVALMEDAARALLSAQARRVAEAFCATGINFEAECVIRDALFREAAMAGTRLERNSPDGVALLEAGQAFIGGEPNAFIGLSAGMEAIARPSPFLAQVREQCRAFRP